MIDERPKPKRKATAWPRRAPSHVAEWWWAWMVGLIFGPLMALCLVGLGMCLTQSGAEVIVYRGDGSAWLDCEQNSPYACLAGSLVYHGKSLTTIIKPDGKPQACECLPRTP